MPSNQELMIQDVASDYSDDGDWNNDDWGSDKGWGFNTETVVGDGDWSLQKGFNILGGIVGGLGNIAMDVQKVKYQNDLDQVRLNRLRTGAALENPVIAPPPDPFTLRQMAIAGSIVASIIVGALIFKR